MVPKRVDSTKEKLPPTYARAQCDDFNARLSFQGMVTLYKGSIFHHGGTICHPKSGYVTTKLQGPSTRGCNNNAIFSDSYAGSVNLAVAKPRRFMQK